MRARIKNYQTSKDVTLEVEGFTAIVGKSNTGKTALMRAIEGSMFNDPVTGRVRHGEKQTEVTVELPNIQWTWTKGDDANDYMVTTDRGTEEYSKVGQRAPKEIAEAGFRELNIDDRKIRLQVGTWREPVFLIDKTGKAVTELISSATRIDVINLAARNCANAMKKTRSTINLREKDLKQAEQQLRNYDVLDEVDLPTIERLWADYQAKEKEIERIDDLLTRHDRIQRNIEALDAIHEIALPEGVDVTQVSELEKIENWLERMDQLQGQIEDLDVLSDVEIPEFTLQEPMDKLTEVHRFMAELLKVARELKEVDDDLEQTSKDLSGDTIRITELRGGLPEDCPLCGRTD